MIPGDGDDRTDDVFHPMGEEWQDELEESLEETEYDTELGMEMARDAQRLVAGELTEAEFYDRYHDAVVEEFGEDDRPMAGEIEAARERGGLSDALSGFDVDDEESRRELMKKMGAGAAFLGLGAMATKENADGEASSAVGDPGDGVAAAQEDDEDDVQWGMAIDLAHCDGCLSCVVACKDEHNLDRGANWMYILAYEDEDRGEEPDLMVRPCQHCSDAPCEKVCPTTARHTRSKDGLVLTDYDICIGCRYCQVACPYGVNYFQWGEPDVPQGEIDPDHIYDERGQWVDSRPPRGVMGKCTFCPSRQDGMKGEELVGTTACEQACPPQIIKFGDMNDPDSDPRQLIDEVGGPADDEPERTSVYRLLEDAGTSPNIAYVGNEPGANAKQIPQEEARERGVDTIVTYEEMDLADNRTEEVLEDSTWSVN